MNNSCLLYNQRPADQKRYKSKFLFLNQMAIGLCRPWVYWRYHFGLPKHPAVKDLIKTTFRFTDDELVVPLRADQLLYADQLLQHGLVLPGQLQPVVPGPDQPGPVHPAPLQPVIPGPN